MMFLVPLHRPAESADSDCLLPLPRPHLRLNNLLISVYASLVLFISHYLTLKPTYICALSISEFRSISSL